LIVLVKLHSKPVFIPAIVAYSRLSVKPVVTATNRIPSATSSKIIHNNCLIIYNLIIKETKHNKVTMESTLANNTNTSPFKSAGSQHSNDEDSGGSSLKLGLNPTDFDDEEDEYDKIVQYEDDVELLEYQR
jgi:hypothetical protein